MYIRLGELGLSKHTVTRYHVTKTVYTVYKTIEVIMNRTIKGRKSGISLNGVPMVWVDVDYTEDGDLEVVNLEDYGWKSIPSWVFSRTSYSVRGVRLVSATSTPATVIAEVIADRTTAR